MNAPHSEQHESITQKLAVPFVISVLLGGFIFYGNDAYKIIGLDAIQKFITIFGYVLGVTEFVVLAILLQRIVQHIVLDRLVAPALGAPTPRLLSQLANVIVYTLAMSAILGVVFKQDLSVVLTAFGGAGLVIGLALQKMISDLFSGLTINLDRSIKLGDYVYLNKTGEYNIEGEVQEISWRTTRLLDTNHNTLIIPNSQVSSSTIINFSTPTTYFKVPISVVLDAEIPIDRALRILTTAAMEVSPQFSPPDAPAPKTTVKAITLQGVEYGVNVYPSFKSRSSSKNLTQQAILQHLACAGLSPARYKEDNRPYTLEHDLQRPSVAHIANLLGNMLLFQGLTPAELQLLANFSAIKALPAKTLIVPGGEIASALFLVIEGLLSAEEWRKKIGKKTTDSNLILGPGSVINEADMLAGNSSEAVVRSKTAVLLCEITHHSFEKLLQENPGRGSYLSLRVAERLHVEMQSGKHSYYQQNGIDTVEKLQTLVFKNLRRSYSNLRLS